MAYSKWDGVKRPKKTRRDKFMTIAELGRFFLAAKQGSYRDYTLFVIAHNLGLRISEAVSLERWSFARVDESIAKIRTLKQAEETIDEINVDPHIARLIKAWIATMPKGQTFLFPSISNGHLSRISAWRSFCRYVEDARLNRIYSTHALRHSRGVVLWQKTRDLEYVRMQLRHKSIASTTIYIHMDPERQREMILKTGCIL